MWSHNFQAAGAHLKCLVKSGKGSSGKWLEVRVRKEVECSHATNLTVKYVFASNSLLYFPTSAMVSQYVSHIICLTISAHFNAEIYKKYDE